MNYDPSNSKIVHFGNTLFDEKGVSSTIHIITSSGRSGECAEEESAGRCRRSRENEREAKRILFGIENRYARKGQSFEKFQAGASAG